MAEVALLPGGPCGAAMMLVGCGDKNLLTLNRVGRIPILTAAEWGKNCQEFDQRARIR